MKVRKPLLKSGTLKSNGKYAKKWLSTKHQWYKLNPPDHAGYYYCYVCGVYLTKAEVELDHVKSRSRHPELRYDLTNIKPICHKDNIGKGSMDIEKYKSMLDSDAERVL